MIIATTIILVIFFGLTLLQLALVAGAPIGHFTWGGQHKVLPTRLRAGSCVSIIVYTLLSILVANKAGIISTISENAFLNISLWTATVYLASGIMLNAISKSKFERYTMTPLTVILVICFLIVALNQ